jgi:eukaryotic-like serine/threonine-protein kinase
METVFSMGAVVEPSLPDALLSGAMAGPWRVEKELGRGGMGSVCAVVHEEIGKRAALKVMHRHLVTVNSAERILLEARVVNQVGHPNIVDIFETGTLSDGRPFIVMERLDGISLAQRAANSKLLPNQVIAILLHVCDALTAAHAEGVIHRDLKLDNVFLIDNPETPDQPGVKLLDWGIAKVLSQEGTHQTIDGQLIGTPQYLSPEQARGGAVSAQTDVYSLGVMAYQLFLEQLPFEAETAAEIMTMHLRNPPPPPQELWPNILPKLEELLLAMLAKQPEARPTVAAVAHTLELVRVELARRRDLLADPGAVIVPERARSTRWTSEPGLAPTESVTRPNYRRWLFALVPLAVATLLALWFATRNAKSATAMSFPDAALDQGAAPPAAISVRVEPPPIATPAPIASPAPHRAAKPSATHKPPSALRRAGRVDPDGTVDPYQ